MKLGVNSECLTVRVVVSDQLDNGVDVVLGVDVIDHLGGVTVTQGRVCFSASGVASVTRLGFGLNSAPRIMSKILNTIE